MVGVGVELEPALEISVAGAERIVAGPRQLFGGKLPGLFPEQGSSAEYTTSTVRFWNFTAWQPAMEATSTSFLARLRSPLWLMPISPTT